jgi:hypothetical protein
MPGKPDGLNIMLSKQKGICNFRLRPSVEERANLRSTDYMDTNPDHNDVISEIPRFYDNLISLYRIHNNNGDQ